LYGWYFNSPLLKTEFSVIYSLAEFLRTNICGLKYFVASDLSSASPEVIKLSFFLKRQDVIICPEKGPYLTLTYQHADS
jgi:hypothetical protein